MSTSLESPLPSHYRSKQEFLAYLPPWRRLLSRLNWHPTIDNKVEQYRLEQRAIDFEQRRIAHKQRMQQLANEIAQIANETEQIASNTEQLRKENAREAELNAKIAALWPSSTSSSHQTPPPERDSPTLSPYCASTARPAEPLPPQGSVFPRMRHRYAQSNLSAGLAGCLC